jgi:molecular chaperone HtpG
VTALRDAHARTEDNSEADTQPLKQSAELLYGLAILAEGGEIDDPAGFSRLIADRIAGTI